MGQQQDMTMITWPGNGDSPPIEVRQTDIKTDRQTVMLKGQKQWTAVFNRRGLLHLSFCLSVSLSVSLSLCLCLSVPDFVLLSSPHLTPSLFSSADPPPGLRWENRTGRGRFCFKGSIIIEPFLCKWINIGCSTGPLYSPKNTHIHAQPNVHLNTHART